MHPILKPALFTLIVSLLVGCADSKITTSSYREKPIEIEEAVKAIRDSGIVENVWKEKYRIRFDGDRFSGELYHGTDGEPFTRYGMDVKFSFRNSNEKNLEILDKLVAKLYDEKTKKEEQNQSVHTTPASAPR
ncbi:hypothetical protein [Pelagicoccus sp. SDUM812003]|uniref:hypothetical protein n=1 Tax=Pelagicoccus sp. SDUM812003 TaxID=3041267 RepID=UPI00280CD2D1|nr:hypothetical protein [Pelagicoccus sp. SDUM812003]MDQ8205755.1 hypothetical protein [Pelagicoccus sp. SDUM812003]